MYLSILTLLSNNLIHSKWDFYLQMQLVGSHMAETQQSSATGTSGLPRTESGPLGACALLEAGEPLHSSQHCLMYFTSGAISNVAIYYGFQHVQCLICYFSAEWNCPPCLSLIVEMGIKQLSIYHILWVQDLVPCRAWLVQCYYPHFKV